jgi:regulation of enolase protein 1 (concanavalin A-like superfamily)
MVSERRISHARGYVDEGNWFEAIIETPSGASGTLSFPLSCLPDTLQGAAKDGQPVWIRVTIERDDARIVSPDSQPRFPSQRKER